MIPERLAAPEHPVAREMLERRADLRAGRDLAQRGTRLAIVVQGGGMRGAISGSALAGLEAMGLGGVFDEAWGESAGAVNLSFFLAGQARFGSRIYVRDACTKRFINPLRLRNIIDLDFMFDEILRGSTELDVEAVLRSPTRFMISATRFDDATPVFLHAQSSSAPLLDLLRASAGAVPLARSGAVIDGALHVDGGIANPIPVRAAVEGGATHVLVLPTVPAGRRSRRPSRAVRLAIAPFLGAWPPELRRVLFDERPQRYNAALDLIEGRVPGPDGVAIAVIPPSTASPPITRLTTDARLMRAVMAAGIAQVHELMGEPIG